MFGPFLAMRNLFVIVGNRKRLFYNNLPTSYYAFVITITSLGELTAQDYKLFRLSTLNSMPLLVENVRLTFVFFSCHSKFLGYIECPNFIFVINVFKIYDTWLHAQKTTSTIKINFSLKLIRKPKRQTILHYKFWLKLLIKRILMY